MDWIVRTPIPIFTHTPTLLQPTRASRLLKVAVNPPPSNFDFRTEISQLSRARIAGKFPQLLDLADSGALLLIEKSQFGPVPPWRSEFVEPEMIWLVGTSHISPKSAADVERVVRTVQPDNVVVELCRSRAGIMYASDSGGDGQQLRSGMFSLSGGNGFLGAIGRSINLGGQTALALRLLLAVFSSKISSDVNRPFGDEFRAARRISEEVGAQIVLGDRPIEITLERAWNCLKWDQRISLVNSVLRGIASQSDISQQTNNNLKDMKNTEEDSAFALYEQLSLSYPSLLQPLIHERDTYLAWSLKRSKAVNKSKRVVGVIGKGHINGVVYSLISDTGNLRFRDLVGKKGGDGSNGFVQNLVNSLIRDTLIGFVLWAAYEFVKGRGLL